jgi:predicted DNA-binding transcriptional regulator YafY
MNRIDRLTAILVQLQGRRVVKAQDIADRFDISLRTVYRDVKALEESGIPVKGEAGMGYSLMEGYRLPPVMFTREEAVAFLTAEKLVEKLTDQAISSNYSAAMYKIRSVLRTTEKDFLENIDGHIEVIRSRKGINNNNHLNLQQVILRSIAEKKVILLNYFSHYKQESSERYVEPVGIFFLDHSWHLLAWCRMRKDYRDFRLDRIADLEITGEMFRQQHLSLKEYIKKMYEELQLNEVVLQVKKENLRYIGEQKFYYGLVAAKEKGNCVEMTFMTVCLKSFARWYITVGDMAKIQHPDELRNIVKTYIEKVSERL